MPRNVCVPCQVEYKPELNEILAIEMASFGPYKVWSADLWKCPKCGHEIVSGFGHAPLNEHYTDGFGEWLENAMLRTARAIFIQEK
jgi:hypothetical protein